MKTSSLKAMTLGLLSRALLAFSLLSLLPLTLCAETYCGTTLASEGAWCWFADPRAIHYENADKSINMSYVGYIDVHGNVKATQFNWNTGEKNDVLVRSYFQPDDHNNPTFLVLPDERVLIIYSRHTDEAAFYYRVSLKPGDITQLGDEKCLSTAGKGNTTYPSPFILSDDPTHWYLCWRGINWHPTMARLTLPDENGDCQFEWGPYQMVQSTGARPYAKYYSNGKDKLYVTYTTGHPDNEQPNWVYFNVININGGGEPTLEDIKGTTLSTIRNGAFNVSKTDTYRNKYPYTVVDNGNGNLRDWVWQIALDDDRQPCIAMVRINGGKTQHEYYYAKWTGSAWRLTDLADGGGQFHQTPGVEMCYSGGLILDQQNPKEIYLSIPTEGDHGKVFEIWKYTLDAAGKIASKEQITRNSTENNVRPFVLQDSKDSPLRLTWMKGYYQYWIVCNAHPKGYPTSIQMDYDYQPLAGEAEGWTYSQNLTMDAASYYGTLLKLGDIEYSLDRTSVKPVITAGAVTATSSNQLYTSDAWKNCPATTDGKSYYSILSQWNLTITYNAQTHRLTTYRNGIIDQVLDVELQGIPEGATPGCKHQPQVQKMIRESILESISLPSAIVTDLVLPTSVGGENIQWSSSNEKIVSLTGAFCAPKAATEITLTATIGDAQRQFVLTAMLRAIEQNLVAAYRFDGTDEGITLMGSAKLTGGRLDLTSNTASGFSTNGYAVVAPEIMDGLRSYTILFEAQAKSLTGQPRFYDFGYNAGNSLFCRAKGFAAGIKYAGGTTTMLVNPSELTTGTNYHIAVSFDAATRMTRIYVDGVLTASGTQNVNEPYMISADASCLRNYIGRTQWWDDNAQRSNNVDFVGTIDNFLIYNTSLTRKEICALQGISYEAEAYKETFDNGDFEGSYTVSSKPSSDRAIYLPEGWTLDYSAKNENDITALKSGDLYHSQFFAGKPQNAKGGNHTLWVRQRWGDNTRISYYQTVLFPEGDYTLTADVLANTTSSSSRAAIFLNDDRVSPTSPNEWQTLSIDFTSDGEEPVRIGLESFHAADEFICGFDNFKLTKHIDTAISEISGDASPAVSARVYDLTGIRISAPVKGINVINGRKVLK